MSPESLTRHATQHLANDHLDVLVVDAHALESVDLLDLVDEVLRERVLAEHLEDVVRVRRTVHQRLARAHAVAFADREVLALRDQVLGRIADLGDDEHLALALGVLAEVHDAVDLADDRVVLRLAGFEQLGDARQTAGDVLRLRRLARDLRDHVAGLDVVAIVDEDVRADRQEVTASPPADTAAGACTVLPSASLSVMRGRASASFDSDDRLARQAGDLVERLLHRDAVDDVAVLHVAGDLGDDRHRERIPLGQELAALDPLAVLDHQARAVLQAVALALATDLVDEHHLALAVHHDRVVLALDELDVVEPDGAVVARLERATARCESDRRHRCGTYASSAACPAHRSTAPR